MEKFIVLITTGLDETIRIFETKAKNNEDLEDKISNEISNYENWQVVPKNKYNLKEAQKLVKLLS